MGDQVTWQDRYHQEIKYSVSQEAVGNLIWALHRLTGYSLDTLGKMVEQELRIHTGELDDE